MNKEEIEARILFCEMREQEYLEVGNTKTAKRYSNEKNKWDKLLNQLNPKMEEELKIYGYYNLEKQIEKYTKIYETKEKMQELDKEDLINMLCASWSRENEKTRQLEVSEQKRLKAIEYINKYSDKGYNFGWILQDGELDKLLEILGD